MNKELGTVNLTHEESASTIELFNFIHKKIRELEMLKSILVNEKCGCVNCLKMRKYPIIFKKIIRFFSKKHKECLYRNKISKINCWIRNMQFNLKILKYGLAPVEDVKNHLIEVNEFIIKPMIKGMVFDEDGE